MRPIAQSEIAEAAGWYEKQKRGLGRELTREVRAAVARLKENPFLYQTVDEEMRRMLLHDFPYGIFFEVHGSDA
jgi:hypothetical protein